jgi:hypothetical protein
MGLRRIKIRKSSLMIFARYLVRVTSRDRTRRGDIRKTATKEEMK